MTKIHYSSCSHCYSARPVGSVCCGNTVLAAVLPALITRPRLGDRIERLLAYVGAKHLKRWYQQLTGKDCGCDARKQWLNELGERRGVNNAV